MTPDPGDMQISRVSIKPPPFWKNNPSLWFRQLEAQFSIANITVDATKFNHVVAAIESDILNTVSDLVMNPPSSDQYDTLKNRLIAAHTESEASKIKTLLQGLELGDQRPSQLLTRMRSLAGNSVGEPLLKSLWLAQLPTTTQSVLAALNEDLSKLATVADKIHDLASHSHNGINAASSTPPNPLEQQLAQLTQQVNELSLLVHRRPFQHSPNNQTGRPRSRSRGRERNYKEPTNNLCFYHINFGAHARKCKPPCSFGPAGN